jgi:hypothetical protein
MRWWRGPLCTRKNTLSSLKQLSADIHVAPLWQTPYSVSEPTRLSSFFLTLHAYRRSNKYQFYSYWFVPIGARTVIYRTRSETNKVYRLSYSKFIRAFTFLAAVLSMFMLSYIFMKVFVLIVCLTSIAIGDTII